MTMNTCFVELPQPEILELSRSLELSQSYIAYVFVFVSVSAGDIANILNVCILLLPCIAVMGFEENWFYPRIQLHVHGHWLIQVTQA